MWDVTNLCHSCGLEEGSFDIQWKGVLTEENKNWTLAFIDSRYAEGVIPFYALPKKAGF